MLWIRPYNKGQYFAVILNKPPLLSLFNWGRLKKLQYKSTSLVLIKLKPKKANKNRTTSVLVYSTVMFVFVSSYAADTKSSSSVPDKLGTYNSNAGNLTILYRQ